MDSCLLAHKRWDEQQGAGNCATMGGTMAVNLMEAEAAQHAGSYPKISLPHLRRLGVIVTVAEQPAISSRASLIAKLNDY